MIEDAIERWRRRVFASDLFGAMAAAIYVLVIGMRGNIGVGD